MSNMSTMTSTTPPTSPPLSPRTIVAPMTPTGVPSFQIHHDTHNTNSDPDPTEWKPVILPTRTSSLASSDAWNYLSQFYGGDETMLLRRPTHRSTASLPGLGSAHSTVPSLTRAPSVASSLSSTASDYLGSIYELSSSSHQRPLPPRHSPYSSSSAAATKGVELVVPHIVSAPGDADTDGDVRVSDSGSILPASSAVWGDGPCEKSATAPINVARLGVRSVQARAQEI